MNIKAFGYNLKKSHVELIQKMATQLTADPVAVCDVWSFEPKTESTDIILVFGIQASNKLNGASYQARLDFPCTDDLDRKEKNKKNREAALAKLRKFKEVLDSGNIKELQQNEVGHNKNKKTLKLTEELPAELTATKVRELEKQARNQETTHWSGWTVDGKSIRVTVEPESGSADINITFAELYAVMGLKEAFQVKELEIVYKPTVLNRKASTS